MDSSDVSEKFLTAPVRAFGRYSIEADRSIPDVCGLLPPDRRQVWEEVVSRITAPIYYEYLHAYGVCNPYSWFKECQAEALKEMCPRRFEMFKETIEDLKDYEAGRSKYFCHHDSDDKYWDMVSPYVDVLFDNIVLLYQDGRRV